jgi:hypothetical protein
MPARARFLRMAANVERYLEENHEHAVILVRELMDRDVSGLCLTSFERHSAGLIGLVQSLAAEGGVKLSPEQGKTLALSLMGAIHMMMLLWCVGGFKGHMEPGPVRYIESFVSILEGWGKVGDGP